MELNSPTGYNPAMSLPKGVEWPVARRFLTASPALSIGLTVGRLASEALRPGVAGAGLVTLLTVSVAALVLRRWPLTQTWPGLLLLAYVFYPEADPPVAVAAIALAAIAWAFSRLSEHTKGVSRPRRLDWLTNIGLLAGFFVLYLLTLAQGVLPADSGEFQLVAAELGVAHPPGFPLYTLMSHLATKLPIGTGAAFRVNLVSALISSATLALVFAAVQQLTRNRAASLLAALALGTSTTFWAQATTANIRTLTAFYVALAFYALLSLSALRHGTEGKERKDRNLFHITLFGAAVTFGVAHHGSLLFISAVMGLYLVLAHRFLLAQRAVWARWFLLGVLAVLPVAYLPWRAAAGALGAPADLGTPAGLIQHVFALGFRGDLFEFLEPAALWNRLLVMGNVLTFQFEPLLLTAMLVGLWLMARRRPQIALLVGGTLLLHTLISATYRAPQTVEYMMPAYVPAVILLGYAAAAPDERLAGFVRPLYHSAVALLFVLVGAQAAEGWSSYRLVRDSSDTRDYASLVLEQAPTDSIVLADWHWANPLWYLQRVEHKRPDVEVRYVFPGSEPYTETWARRIAQELDSSRPVVATRYDPDAYAELPPPQPAGEAFLFTNLALEQLPPGFETLDVDLGSAVLLRGFRMEARSIALGDELELTLAWEFTQGTDALISLFAHLVDPAGRLVAQADVSARAQAEGITLTRLLLTPGTAAPPGRYQLLIGAYRQMTPQGAGGDVRYPLDTVEIVPSDTPPATRHRTNRPLADGSGQTLVGFDWDDTLPGRRRLYLHWRSSEGFFSEARDDAEGSAASPPWFGPWGLIRQSGVNPGRQLGHYVPFGQGVVWVGETVDAGRALEPGETVTLVQHFRSSRPLDRDIVVSVRLVGYEEDGRLWAWWDLADAVPAMGAVPTLKWIGGSKVRDPHFVTVSPLAPPGQTVGALLRLYEVASGRPLPILDERISGDTPWVPLGTTNVSPAP
jgi:hypothetical protein